MLFAATPVIVAVISVIGLNGDLTQVEALVPVYLVALVFALVAVGIYGITVISRAIQWIAASIR